MNLTKAQQDVINCVKQGGSVSISYSWAAEPKANACFLTLSGGYRVAGVRASTVQSLINLGALEPIDGQAVSPGALVKLKIASTPS